MPSFSAVRLKNFLLRIVFDKNISINLVLNKGHLIYNTRETRS